MAIIGQNRTEILRFYFHSFSFANIYKQGTHNLLNSFINIFDITSIQLEANTRSVLEGVVSCW